MRPSVLFVSLAALALAAGCATLPEAEAEPVAELEPSRYLGTWYEIASIPQWFSRGCTCTTATYEPIDAETISVVNRCRKDSPEGEVDVARGKAFLPDADEPAGLLRVQFFAPFRADYRVIELGGEAGEGPYTYAVVGSGEDALWVLSRTPEMDPELLEDLLREAARQGYEVSEVQKTRQAGCWEERGISAR